MSTTGIVAGIKAVIVGELGATYTELPFSIDVAKNKFGAGTRGYAVLPDKVDEADGVTRHVTVDQAFTIKLTETFNTAQVGDSSQRLASQTLYDRMNAVYKQLINQKAGVPASVMRVSGLTVQPTEYIDSNVAVLRATVNIRYRTVL